MAGVQNAAVPAKVVHRGYHPRGGTPTVTIDDKNNVIHASMPARSELAPGQSMEVAYGDMFYRKPGDSVGVYCLAYNRSSRAQCGAYIKDAKGTGFTNARSHVLTKHPEELMSSERGFLPLGSSSCSASLCKFSAAAPLPPATRSFRRKF